LPDAGAVLVEPLFTPPTPAKVAWGVTWAVVVAAAVALPVAVAVGLCAPATDAHALNTMDATTNIDNMIEVLFMHSLLVSQ
jgi:hypothetical protein